MLDWDSTILRAVWVSSLSLSTLSILFTLVLVLLRLSLAKKTRTLDADRKTFRSALISYSATLDTSEFVAAINSVPADIAISEGFAFLALVRGNIEEKIQRAFQSAGLAEHVIKQLEHGNTAKRLHAAEILSAFPGRETQSALHRALQDRSAEVRLAAAISMAKLELVESVKDLVNSLGHSTMQSHRAIDFFAMVAPRLRDQVLAFSLDTSNDPAARTAAVRALALKEELTLFPRITDFLTDPVEEIVAVAARGLGDAGHPSAIPFLLALLTHQNWEVRMEAINSLGKLGSTESLLAISNCLTDPEWPVRRTAARALLIMGDAGVSELSRKASGKVGRGQRVARLTLAEVGLVTI